MGRPKQPIEVQEAKRRIHRSKHEIEERRASQVKSDFTGSIEPSGLTKKEQESFWYWANILDKLGILSDLDVDALARYVKAQTRYLKAEQLLSAALRAKPKNLDDIEQAQRIQDKALKTVTSCAKCLGMTIDSRARLIVPEVKEEPKENKFAKFGV